MASIGEDVINFTITAEDQSGDAVKSAQKNLNIMDVSHKESEKTGKLAFWGIGEAAENAADSLGVPTKMSRKLGNEVEDLAAMLGKGAIAFGVIGLAGMAIYGIYEQLVESKRKEREELERSVSAMEGEMTQLYKNTQESQSLTKARYDYLQVEREIYQFKLAEKYQALYEDMQKLNEAAVVGPGLWKTLVMQFKAIPEAMEKGVTVEKAFEDSLAQLRAKGTEESRKLAAELEILYEKIKQLSTPVSLNDYTGRTKEIAESTQKALLEASQAGLKAYTAQWSDFHDSWNVMYEAMKDRTNAVNRLRQQDLNDQAAYSASIVSYAQAVGTDLETQQALELQAYDDAFAAKYNAMKGEQAKEDALAKYELDRETLLVKNKKALYNQDYNNKRAVLGGIEELAQAAYEASGEQMKAFFYLARAARAGETFMHYEAAAAAAAATMNYPLEAFYHGMAYTMPALIMAQAFGEANSSSSSSSASADTSSMDTGTSSSSSDTSSTTEEKTGPSEVIVHIVNSTVPLTRDQEDAYIEETVIPGLVRAQDRNITVVRQ